MIHFYLEKQEKHEKVVFKQIGLITKKSSYMGVLVLMILKEGSCYWRRVTPDAQGSCGCAASRAGRGEGG